MVVKALFGILWCAGILLAQKTNTQGDEEDLLSLLEDNTNEEIPPERYSELGMGDGMFNGKKIKRIMKVKDEYPGDNLEKVLDIQDVESIHKINDIKKIKSMFPIDEDLALKMKKEIQGAVSNHGNGREKEKGNGDKNEITNDGDSKGDQDPELAAKVERVLKMFNANDLDDIIKVIPISSMRKIKSKTRVPTTEDNGPDSNEFKDEEKNTFGDPYQMYGRRPSEYTRYEVPEPVLPVEDFHRRKFEFQEYIPSSPPKINIGNMRRYGEKFETENEAIRKLDDDIDGISDRLLNNAEVLNKERDFQQILAKMLRLEKDKIRMIEEVMDDHRAKEIDVSKATQKIQQMLKSAKNQKIHHLKNLQSLAGKHIAEIGEGYETQIDDAASVRRRSFKGYDPRGYENTNDGRGKYIDKSLYDVLPLKKITSIKKLKSILELTPVQADRLRQWQEERNGGKEAKFGAG